MDHWMQTKASMKKYDEQKMYWNLECIDSFKIRQNARTGRTNSKYPN